MVSHTMLRAASIKSQASMSKQKVKALEDGDDVMDVVLVDFRHGAPPEVMGRGRGGGAIDGRERRGGRDSGEDGHVHQVLSP